MRKTDTLLVGIDVGTTSVKGSVYTATGECVFVKSLPYPTVNLAEPEWVEQNPVDWMDRVKQICAEALQSIGQGSILAKIDTGAFGAALIAGVGVGIYADLATAGSAAVNVEKAFLPNPAKWTTCMGCIKRATALWLG